MLKIALRVHPEKKLLLPLKNKRVVLLGLMVLPLLTVVVKGGTLLVS
uniref:Uncharacterized protein n=1 Tax=virus sp. ct8MV80 TaxID=2826793 RepID=A0A8S5R857_9VIRU|nr:MAG TPA: hypothetical protein [virus sp. ct8MV80]